MHANILTIFGCHPPDVLEHARFLGKGRKHKKGESQVSLSADGNDANDIKNVKSTVKDNDGSQNDDIDKNGGQKE